MDDTTQAHAFHEIQQLFSNDEVCRNHLFHLRWPAGYVCSLCGSHRYDVLKKRQILQCRNCKHQTSPIAGTIMHRTRTPLRYWFWGIFYVAACNGETTVQQLAEKIGLNYHAARRMLGKIHKIEKDQGFLGDLLKSFNMPERSREEISTGPGMETQSRLTKESYPLIERTIPDGKKFEIPGYSLKEVIYESNWTRLWRGKRQSDGLLVLIKESVTFEQSAQELAEMRHEHEITQALEIDGVLRAEELVRGENGWALILENTEGFPLRKLMDAARLDLPDSLKVAVSLSNTLKEVHQQGILHKMINPLNIFVDPGSGNIILSGFGLASRLPKENLTTLSP